MKNWMLKTSIVAIFGVMLMTQSAQAQFGFSTGYYYAPTSYYAAPVYSVPVYPVYQSVVVPQVVYRPAYVVRPAVTTYVVPPVPVYGATYAVPSYTRTSSHPHGRFARYKQTTYSPYGIQKTEYRFDKKYGTWRVKSRAY